MKKRLFIIPLFILMFLTLTCAVACFSSNTSTDARTKLTTPTADTTTYYYTGKTLTYTPANFSEDTMTITNNEQNEVGSYVVTVSIKDTTTYTWANGTTDDLTFNFEIQKVQVTKPISSGNLSYTGKIQSYIPYYYENCKEYIALSDDTTGTNIGTYTMTVTLKDTKNMVWADGDTNASFTLNWEIVKNQFDIPTTRNISYCGSEITFYPKGWNSDQMTISGNTGTDIGTYTATISLNDKENTCWSDGTTEDKSVEWQIVEASNLYTVTSTTKKSTTTLTLKNNETLKTLTVKMPSITTFQINDEDGSLSLFYIVSGEEEAEEGEVTIEFTLSGEFDGSVNINESNESNSENEYTVDVTLESLTISDDENCPLCLLCDDDVELSAKKATENTINDNRTTQNENEEYNSAIYCSSDLKLKATGTLNVNSDAYGGIHCKDDLKIQKLTLNVNAYDNAIKGNDGITIVSGTITAISTYSNGLKTSNSSLSSKGKQKGTVTIYGGTINIYSALDGIESAYDVIFTENPDEEEQVDIVMTITTCTYSTYTKRTYTRESSTSLMAIMQPGRPGEQQGWQPGSRGGVDPKGEDSGNTNKYEESTKGIKANNEITIERGTITIKSYDDAIHSNNDNAIESTGANGLGNVTISGGTLTIYSMDDGIHADNILKISGGTISITNSYEGLEGSQVIISGGSTSVVSTDDGINGTSTTGEAIIISGGVNYIYAGGDGIDSNSTASYDSILFAGGKTVIIQTSGGNSSIDTERGYKYTGGYVLALGLSNGMSAQESTKCSNFNSIGKTATLTGTTFTASGFVTVKLSNSMSTYAIFLGSNSTSLSTSATYTDYDSNGVCWNESLT